MNRENEQAFLEIVYFILFPKGSASLEWIYILLPYLKHKYTHRHTVSGFSSRQNQKSPTREATYSRINQSQAAL